MRVLLIASFLVFVLGLGAVLFLPGFVDVGDYRDKISQNIEEIAGRKVKIHGAVSFNVFPSPRISIEKLAIANGVNIKHEDFLTIEKLEGEISLFSLIKGDVKMTNLLLINPVLNFDILKTGEKAWEQSVDQSQGNVFKRVTTGIHFDHVKIQDGAIRYYSELKDNEQELSSISAEIVSESLKGPFSLKGISSYKENDVQFNIIGGKITSEGSAPVRVELLSDKATLSGDFAGVITVFEEGDESFEAQGEVNIQGQDINRLESFSFIGGMEASLLKAKGFLTLNNQKMSLTNLSGNIGQTPFSGKVETVFCKCVSITANTDLKIQELNFVGVKAKDLGSNKDLISKLPIGDIRVEIAKANFEDAVLENILLEANNSSSLFLVKAAQAILPGQTGLNVTEARLSKVEDSKIFQMNMVINHPQEFFKWAEFKLLPNPNFTANDKINLDVSYNQGKAEAGLKAGYSVDFTQDGKSFKATYSTTIDSKPAIRELALSGDYIDLDQLGYSSLISDTIKSKSWINAQNWNFDVSVDEIKYDNQNLKNVAINLTNLGPQVELNGFYIEDFYGSTINAKGSYDAESNSKPFDFLVNVKSKDLKVLTENLPLDIEFPSYEYGQSDLSVSFGRKEAKKNLTLSGTMMGAKWQMDGVLDDLSFKGDHNLVVRTTSDDLGSFFSHFSKDTDMSLLKDKKGDFYTTFSKEGNNVKFSNLKGTADEVPFKGDIHVIDKKITATLDIDAINLDKNKTYLSFAKSILDKNDMNGTLDVKAKKAKFKTQNFDAVTVNADFDKSKATINKLTFGWMGKPHQATGFVDWNGDYNFDITTDSIDLGMFKSALPLTATNASAQTKFSGNDDVFKGESDIKIKNGSFTKMDLEVLSAGLNSDTMTVDTLLAESFAKGTTAFSLANASLDFDKEGIKVKSFEAAGDFGKIVGSEGFYNFGDKTYGFDMEVKLVSPTTVPAFDVTYGSKNVSFKADDLKSFADKSKGDDIGGILERLEEEKAINPTVPQAPVEVPAQELTPEFPVDDTQFDVPADPVPNQLNENDLQEPVAQ